MAAIISPRRRKKKLDELLSIAVIWIIAELNQLEQQAVMAARTYISAGHSRDFTTMAKFLLTPDGNPKTAAEVERWFWTVEKNFKYDTLDVVPANIVERLLLLPFGETRVIATRFYQNNRTISTKLTFSKTKYGLILEDSSYIR